MKLISQLPKTDLKNKRVLVRVDLNVPTKNGTILNDYRLQAILPTIQLLQSQGAKIILITHRGRPEGHEPELSTKILIPWLEHHGFSIVFAPTIEQAHEESNKKNSSIVLLENLRFFPGEKKRDNDFAKQLASLGDYYVNDAFGTLHRHDSSVALVPELFSAEKRSIGLLIEKELAMLKKLVEKPQQPYVVLVGGGKIKTKIPTLASLVGKAQTIVLLPAIVFTFLKALGKPIGTSFVDDTMLETCKKLLATAQEKGTEIIFPVDYQVADKKFTGPLSEIDSDEIPAGKMGISVGPKTIALLKKQLLQAQTIFYNGLMGDQTREETLTGSKAIFSLMAQSPGFSVIGGGDSVAIGQKIPEAKEISYFSTGGGTTLAFLSGQELPGLKPFLKNRTET
jgi:3-phosphoglycerate kinase